VTSAVVEKTCTNTDATGEYVRINISGNVSEIPTKVARKKASERKQKKNVLVTGLTIEPIGDGEYFGFEIDGSDRLFLLGDFTVTHNTILFAKEAERTLPHGRVCVIAHRKELIDQAVDKIHQATGIRAGVEMGQFRAAPMDEIVVGSVQTLVNRLPAGSQFHQLIIDEAHHCTSDNQYNDVIGNVRAEKLLGVTATPYRGDKKKLNNVFDDMPFSLSIIDLIDRGYLANVRVKTLPVEIDLSAVRTYMGDFSDKGLGDALAPMLDKLARIVAEDYADRKILAFCPLVDTSQAWTEALRHYGLPAEHVDGASPDRAEILQRFTNDDIRMLSCSSLLTEGYDEPSIDCVVILRPTKSRVLMAQMIGRGTRLFPGKEDLLVLDPMFTAEKHNILSPADLAAETDDDSAELKDLMKKGRTLTQAVEELREERRRRLAEQLADASNRSPYEKKLAELALVLGDDDIQGWEPTARWHSEQASDRQMEVLKNMGVDLSLIQNKGHASHIMDCLMKRKDRDLGSLKQIRYARKLGHPEPERISRQELSAWIDGNQPASHRAYSTYRPQGRVIAQ
jgi:superfamily II DNA or RNA helicase